MLKLLVSRGGVTVIFTIKILFICIYYHHGINLFVIITCSTATFVPYIFLSKLHAHTESKCFTLLINLFNILYAGWPTLTHINLIWWGNSAFYMHLIILSGMISTNIFLAGIAGSINTYTCIHVYVETALIPFSQLFNLSFG